jgi:predicted dehydrogenase
MNRTSRRRFLQHSAAAAGAISAPWIIPSGALGADGAPAPSDRVNVGLIGVGPMGQGHLRRLAHGPEFQVLAVCDVDATRRQAAREMVEGIYAERTSGRYSGCVAYNDYRELLARRDIDAVVIVTPDHWHTLLSIDAAKAGKDVYCEKPVSLTIGEGRELARAIRKHNRVFQTGTQYRSIPTIRRVCQFVRDGGLGKIKSVFTLLDPLDGFLRAGRFAPYAKYVDPDKNGRFYAPLDVPLPEEPVPAGLDWDLWVGPAPWRAYNRLYHENPSPGLVPWSFAAAFGAAAITWHLSHSADVIHYALGVEKSGPVEIIHPSSGDFPTMTCRYANGTLLHFVDHWGMVKDVYKALPPETRLAGNFGGVFIGERGWITSMTTGGRIEGGPGEIFEELKLFSRNVHPGANDHHANWIECIRTRKQPSCDEELGHRSASLGHLAMISYRLGRSLRWDPAKEQFINDEAADQLRSRAARRPWRIEA